MMERIQPPPEPVLPQEVLTFARRAARSWQPLLLAGETGTGKSHLAAYIHRLSSRRRRPIVVANCGEVSDSLFEREMFGHVRGAFTGATESRLGLFEAADTGTLVLDDVSDLPPSLQGKLLAVLDSGRIRRIGSPRDIKVDVRVIATTNADVLSLVERRRFRSDLYFRLNVIQFRVPPLREQVWNLGTLIRHLLDGMATDTPSGPKPDIASQAMLLLKRYPWPGNIRELDHALRSALFYSEGCRIEAYHLPTQIRDGGSKPESVADAPRTTARYSAPIDPAEERRLLIDALRAANGNRTRAAQRLKMSRATLWYKVRLHGIDDPDLDHA